MSKPFSIAMMLGILVAGAALAAPASPPSPQTDLAALRQAIFTPDAGAAGLPPGAQPMIATCPAGTPFCTNAACRCKQTCWPNPGTVVGCWPDRGTYDCRCGLQ
jgi:hypothetical protein